MSNRDLQGRYIEALAKIGRGAASTPAKQKPIYQREPETTEQQAIEQAAQALSALWKLGTR